MVLEDLWHWNLSYHNWLGVGATVLLLLMVAHWFQLQDPRRQERAVARTLERQKVADIVSAALQDAAHRQEITPVVWHKYNKKLARSLGLPDMEPRPKLNPKRVKFLIRQRLERMGVDITAALKKMRRRRPTKKEKLLTSLNNKSKA